MDPMESGAVIWSSLFISIMLLEYNLTNNWDHLKANQPDLCHIIAKEP